METKSSIRKRILALRNDLSPEACRLNSSCIMQRVLELPMVKSAKHILCYAGYKSEVITEDLIMALLQIGKQVYLPRVNGEEMDFYQVKGASDLTQGYKGIPEPSPDCHIIFTKEMWEQNIEQTIMFLPGAAFSEDGARIGYGKGYYDRYLMKLPCQERIALCYEMQMVDAIPSDAHDIPVTTIVTEEKIRNVIPGSGQKSILI